MREVSQKLSQLETLARALNAKADSIVVYYSNRLSND